MRKPFLYGGCPCFLGFPQKIVSVGGSGYWLPPDGHEDLQDKEPSWPWSCKKSQLSYVSLQLWFLLALLLKSVDILALKLCVCVRPKAKSSMSSSSSVGCFIRDENWTQIYFSHIFRAPPGYPGKIPGYPAKKSLVSLGFEGHTEPFGPHPFTWKTPTPPEISGQKSLGLGSRFRVPGPPARKYEKKYEKVTKSPTPGRAPKIRKKYRKNTKTVIFGPFACFFIFVFSGPDPGWGISWLFHIFFVFPSLRGFWALYQERGIASLGSFFFPDSCCCLPTKQHLSFVLLFLTVGPPHATLHAQQVLFWNKEDWPRWLLNCHSQRRLS